MEGEGNGWRRAGRGDGGREGRGGNEGESRGECGRHCQWKEKDKIRERVEEKEKKGFGFINGIMDWSEWLRRWFISLFENNIGLFRY